MATHQSLSVDVDKTVVLALTTLALGVGGEFGTAEIEGVDDGQRESTGGTTRGNVSTMISLVSEVPTLLRTLQLYSRSLFSVNFFSTTVIDSLDMISATSKT